MRRKRNSNTISRREALRGAAVAAAAGVAPAGAFAQAARADYANLAAAGPTLEAVVARLIPSDANGPGAAEAGAALYIDRALGDALAYALDTYRSGLAALDRYSETSRGARFSALRSEQQDEVLGELENNQATGFSPDSATFFNLMLEHTFQGTFCDPVYGGNRDFIGWEMIGYPGLKLAVTAEQQSMNAPSTLTRLSAYDLPMFEDGDSGGDN